MALMSEDDRARRIERGHRALVEYYDELDDFHGAAAAVLDAVLVDGSTDLTQSQIDSINRLAKAGVKDTHTPSRNFRAPDEEWLPAKAEAARRGETITDALRRFLREYVQDDQRVQAGTGRVVTPSS